MKRIFMSTLMVLTLGLLVNVRALDTVDLDLTTFESVHVAGKNNSNDKTLDRTQETKVENTKLEDTSVIKDEEGNVVSEVKVSLVDFVDNTSTWYFTVDKDCTADLFVVKAGNGYVKYDLNGFVFEKGVIYAVKSPVELANVTKKGEVKLRAISHLSFYNLREVVKEEEKTHGVKIDFLSDDVSHIDFFYINDTTGEVTFSKMSKAESAAVIAAGTFTLEAKEGYTLGFLVKQSTHAYIWTLEEKDESVLEVVYAEAKKKDTSRYDDYEAGYGLGENLFTYTQNGKIHTKKYTFSLV